MKFVKIFLQYYYLTICNILTKFQTICFIDIFLSKTRVPAGKGKY